MAFVSPTPIISRSSTAVGAASITSRRSVAVTPLRRAALRMAGEGPEMQKIPQGFTSFSEMLNGRAAMLGFSLAVVTELITGKGILGQVGSVFEIVNLASALGN
ncbi:hypothetical protein BWQ96_03119 [Gracilariopsis chorda]|uniref:Uncharacterized protein n=1 Tax=Gracilariopsis chorda TaxID=448386 RepID=A0A2V3IZR8_9FLOR|nr:hypothetical protein BWQ96_10248 [Gracilariopsis chorda]PXF47177.1 hypothetical protein BWQ96_03119 [Gracilariopsis chorda]|eukprot:PXF40043.1 hypothetical protein BWQ96_10248 [Gracilariopsis chorda]